MATLKWWDIHEIHREKIKNNTGPTPRLMFIPPGMWAWFEVCLDLFSGRTTIHVHWTTTPVWETAQWPDSLGHNISFPLVNTWIKIGSPDWWRVGSALMKIFLRWMACTDFEIAPFLLRHKSLLEHPINFTYLSRRPFQNRIILLLYLHLPSTSTTSFFFF